MGAFQSTKKDKRKGEDACQEDQGDAGAQKFLEDLKKATQSDATPRKILKLRLKSISEYLQKTGVIQNKNLFKEIFQIITPSSEVTLFSDVQEDILNILKVATKNGVEEDLIRKAFKKIKIKIYNLTHLELMSYSTLINLSHIKVKGKKDFSEDEWNVISNNIIHCGQVCLYDSTLPIYHEQKLIESTSAAADKRDEMKLKELTFCNMPISSEQAMTVANLACFTEKVEFINVCISQTSIRHICEHLMKQKQQRLTEIEFRKCPIMHPDMKRKMEESGVRIHEYRPTTNVEKPVGDIQTKSTEEVACPVVTQFHVHYHEGNQEHQHQHHHEHKNKVEMKSTFNTNVHGGNAIVSETAIQGKGTQELKVNEGQQLPSHVAGGGAIPVEEAPRSISEPIGAECCSGTDYVPPEN